MVMNVGMWAVKTECVGSNLDFFYFFKLEDVIQLL